MASGVLVKVFLFQNNSSVVDYLIDMFNSLIGIDIMSYGKLDEFKYCCGLPLPSQGESMFISDPHRWFRNALYVHEIGL